MPSAKVVALSVSTIFPAATDSLAVWAFSDTTPTILVFDPKALRAMMVLQIPDPQPIAT